VRWLLDVIKAMIYLREQRVLHRDIKTENILLRADLTAALGDFDLARRLDSDVSSALTAGVGTHGCIASEVEYGPLVGERYSYPADIYSFGITMVDMLCGSRGRNRQESLDGLKQIVGDSEHMGILLNIATRCTQPTELRPDAKLVCNWLETLLEQWGAPEISVDPTGFASDPPAYDVASSVMVQDQTSNHVSGFSPSLSSPLHHASWKSDDGIDSTGVLDEKSVRHDVHVVFDREYC
jgi:serine/threonine protein kinase